MRLDSENNAITTQSRQRISLLTFKIEEVTFSSSVCFSLSDDDSWHNLLSKLWLSLLDGSEERLSNRCRWESVKSSTDHGDGNDVKCFTSGVVATVKCGGNWETSGDLLFDSASSLSGSL